MNIFEKATREQYRFETVIGQLSTEQLWELPLATSRAAKASLDTTARHIFAELKTLDEGSFVELRPDPRKAELEVKLEVVKHIIAVRMAENAEALVAADKAERKRKLLAALDAKVDQETAAMSKEQIEEAIAAL